MDNDALSILDIRLFRKNINYFEYRAKMLDY